MYEKQFVVKLSILESTWWVAWVLKWTQPIVNVVFPRIYVMGGMGVDSDLSTMEVYNPTTKEWKMLNYEMKEVNGWCTVCLGTFSI